MSIAIRNPKQARSIETKHKILEAGLSVFSEKGYYNTNTAEIAKIAGVSTGIVYGYFKDKKDIFLQTLDLYFDHVLKPIENTLNAAPASQNLEDTLREFIHAFITSHQENAVSHEEMLAMSHLDHDVHKRFINSESRYTDIIKTHLIKKGLDETNLDEKVHVAYNMIESLCHESVYHQHPNINYDAMTEIIVDVMLHLFDKS